MPENFLVPLNYMNIFAVYGFLEETRLSCRSLNCNGIKGGVWLEHNFNTDHQVRGRAVCKQNAKKKNQRNIRFHLSVAPLLHMRVQDVCLLYHEATEHRHAVTAGPLCSS